MTAAARSRPKRPKAMVAPRFPAKQQQLRDLDPQQHRPQHPILSHDPLALLFLNRIFFYGGLAHVRFKG